MAIFNEYLCMLRSYKLLTGRMTFKDMMNKHKNVTLIFDPSKKVVVMKDDLYDILIDYFAEDDDFEKCIELQKAKEIALLKQDGIIPD